MSKNIIIFDFDGVIFDSFGIALKTIKTICPVKTGDDYKKLFEGNIFASRWQDEVKHSPECRHDLEFFDIYTPLMQQAKLFPGVFDFIQRISKDYFLIIVSSSLTKDIQKILENEKLDSCFKEIMGKDVDRSKIKKLQIVLDKYNKTPEKVLFVTDTLGDIKEANHLNISSIGVTWGWHTKETLETGKPIKIVNDFQRLESEIEAYFKK
jgi:phosphoglycolate phosphatase